MTPEMIAAVVTPIITAVITIATLFYKDRADERRHRATQTTAKSAAVSAVVAADEATKARTEIADRLDNIQADVNGKTDAFIALATKEAYDRGVQETEGRGC